MAFNTNNPFDFMNNFNQYDPQAMIRQMQAAFGGYKIPNVDMEALAKSQQKNMEALMKANEAAVAGTQELLKRQAELFQEALKEAGEAAQSMSTGSDPQEAAAKQVELVQAAVEKALKNSTEISEMVTKTQSDVAETVNIRVAEGLKEVKDVVANLK
ncbi:MAG: phasin family protein [Gammaproteobacteria bacterium]|nr:MAG: phasin family protein [Gammaproteobacteria bacterium]